MPERIMKRLRIPLIAAPMLNVSGPELVIGACQAGVIGAFPTANARTIDELESWLVAIKRNTTGVGSAPFCPNLIIRQPRMRDDLARIIRHNAEMVITSVGSPAEVVTPLHDVGCLVFADVATLRHAEKAIAVGVDGLILLTAGAGGQTGWLNPFSFVRAVRKIFDGPIVLAGGISDGASLWSAQVLGCDLAYMGTKFIATAESRADDQYKKMLVESTIDDVVLTSAFTGLRTNMLLPSILAAGFDPSKLDEQITVPEATEMYGGKTSSGGPKRWRDIWSAGHTVSGVQKIQSAADLVEQTLLEFNEAREATLKM
jgi:nitronate monooxygenase